MTDAPARTMTFAVEFIDREAAITTNRVRRSLASLGLKLVGVEFKDADHVRVVGNCESKDVQRMEEMLHAIRIERGNRHWSFEVCW